LEACFLLALVFAYFSTFLSHSLTLQFGGRACNQAFAPGFTRLLLAPGCRAWTDGFPRSHVLLIISERRILAKLVEKYFVNAWMV